MRLGIKSIQQEQFSVDVPGDDITVAEVKQIIEKQTQHPASWQKLVHSGKLLADDDKLSKYGVKDGDFFVLIDRTPESDKAESTVTVPSAPPTPTPVSVTVPVPQSVAKLKFQTNDSVVEVDKDLALIIMPVLETRAQLEEPVNVNEISSSTLHKIVEYTVYHKDHHGINTPFSEIDNWDREFLNLNQPALFALILAANNLGYKRLVDLTCKKVADMMRGKSSEEIRSIFNIRNDFTPQEEEQMRRENEQTGSPTNPLTGLPIDQQQINSLLASFGISASDLVAELSGSGEDAEDDTDVSLSSESFVCPTCSTTLPNFEELQIHFLTVHPDNYG